MSATVVQESKQKQWSASGVALSAGILTVPAVLVTGFITLFSMVIN